jgi:UDP-N-acetylmuramyl pentapeptide phosphotransferase/UDP-N-acetylglucosamine-1-phosphate transferase
MGLAGWAAMCFAIAFAGTWAARRYALHAALVDHPGERRSHATATPRGGGIAIVIAMLPVLAVQVLRAPGQAALAGAILAGLLLVAAVGWADDHRPLSPWPRLAIHVVAAMVLGFGLHASGASAAVAFAGFLAAVVLVNAWNFMDGIDGLAASQALVVALGYALYAGGPVAWAGVALAAACAGFLPFNRPPARIFLGDVGSGALGFLVAALAAQALAGASWTQAPGLLLPLVAFGGDAALTLARRLLRRERWWEPHVDHAFQRQARRHGHARVAFAFLAWTLVEIGFMLATRTASALVIMCAAGISILLAFLAWRALQAAGGPANGVDA